MDIKKELKKERKESADWHKERMKERKDYLVCCACVRGHSWGWGERKKEGRKERKK